MQEQTKHYTLGDILHEHNAGVDHCQMVRTVVASHICLESKDNHYIVTWDYGQTFELWELKSKGWILLSSKDVKRIFWVKDMLQIRLISVVAEELFEDWFEKNYVEDGKSLPLCTFG